MTADQLELYARYSGKDVKDCPFADSSKSNGEKNSDAYHESYSNPIKRSTIFNAQQQRIHVSDEHAWKARNFAAGDQRGPCPGLNALANHGYLPRNGVADMATLVKATNDVYGLGLDIGGILAVIGTVFDGNPVSLIPGFSIGGPSQNSQNILGGLGLLGTPEGLSGSHNKYESDSSATRGDLYLYGNNFNISHDQFVDYYFSIPENTPASEQYTALASLHKRRFDHSKANNPYFFYAPFSSVLVSVASYSFPVRMMANHSEQYPDGYLSRQTFASFFGVEGHDESNFVMNQGGERISDNWYRRPIGDDFSLAAFLLDVVEHGLIYPPLLSIGGNTGTPNSFAGVDISDLTGGVFDAASLLDPEKLQCFVLQLVMTETPDFLGSSFSNLPAAMAPLLDRVQQALTGKLCPQLNKINSQLFEKYPGYTKAYNGYTGLPRKGLLG
ncbi:oxidase [Seiridium cupressi]